MSDFLQAARFTEKDAPQKHQAAAWAWAWARLTTEEQAEFLTRFRQGSTPVPPQPADGNAFVKGNPLVVRYFSQRDSATGEAARMCFSSSCAMLLEALRPGTLSGPNGDDQYLQTVHRFGDTTDAAAQVRALAHYGVTATMVQNADFALVRRQLQRGIPVPAGYIHRGPVDRPQGGGHYLAIVGIGDDHVVVHDPWGEADLVSGATVSANGRYCRYSFQNFGRRWMVEPDGQGSYRSAPGRGWAIIAE